MNRNIHLRSLVFRIQVSAILIATLVLGFLTYQRLRNVILKGFDRKLAAVSTSCSVFQKGEDMEQMLREKDPVKRQGLDPEQQPLYLQYIRPMRSIKDRADLTFLYTQILRPEEDRGLIYVLDATVGESHSPLGMEDKLPAEDWNGALRVVQTGQVYLTGIRTWDIWGMLKCGWAPIYGADRSIKAMSGADVNIGIIHKKVNLALLKRAAVGLLAIVLAGLSSLFISRRLTAPLDEIREASLRVAAGQYDWRSQIAQPREMARLSTLFNRVAEAAQRQIQQQQEQLERWKRERVLRLLNQKLQTADYFSDSFSCAMDSDSDPSGYCLHQQWALVWLARPFPSAIENIRFRHTLKCLAERLFLRGPERILTFMEPLFPESIECLLLFNRQDASLSVVCRTPHTAWHRISSGMETIPLEAARNLALAEGEWLFLPRFPEASKVESKIPCSETKIKEWMRSGTGASSRFAVFFENPGKEPLVSRSKTGGES